LAAALRLVEDAPEEDRARDELDEERLEADDARLEPDDDRLEPDDDRLEPDDDRLEPDDLLPDARLPLDRLDPLDFLDPPRELPLLRRSAIWFPPRPATCDVTLPRNRDYLTS